MEKQNKTIVVSWIVPGLILVAVIFVMMFNFSNKSSADAKDTISKNLIKSAQEYSDDFLYELETLCNVASPFRVWLEENPDLDEADTADMTAILYSCTDAYKVLYCDQEGTGIDQTGAQISVAGSVLGIRPILYVRDDGKIYVAGKVRGKSASTKALFDMFEKHAVNPKAQTVYISHADCPEEAQRLAGMLKGKVKDVVIGYIGPVFGCHCGPDSLSMYFLCDEREP